MYLTCSGQGQVAGCCEHGNEPSGVIKCGEFYEWLRNSEHQLYRRVADEWLYVLVYLWTVSSTLHEKVKRQNICQNTATSCKYVLHITPYM